MCTLLTETCSVVMCRQPSPPDSPTLGDPPPEVFVMIGDMFVFNCTSIPGNPEELNIAFGKDRSPVTPSGSVTVEGPLLTFPSVLRSDSGNYSCSVSNTAGMTAAYHSLTVVGGCGEGSGHELKGWRVCVV